MTAHRFFGISAAAFIIAAGAGTLFATELPPNDYPTEARADYVFGCMAVNGQSREVLRKCSCSIDVIASLMPYKEYEEAETVMSLVQRESETAGLFRSYQPLVEKVNDLKRAQVEGELRCF